MRLVGSTGHFRATGSSRDANRTIPHGEYGDPDEPDSHRTWWVAIEPCEGRALQVGAMWGDVAPWTLEPGPAHVFTGRTFVGDPIRATFDLAPTGTTALDLEMGDDRFDLVRIGDLPEEFGPECMPR